LSFAQKNLPHDFGNKEMLMLSPVSSFPKNQRFYTAQMHIHGYSNHNGSQSPGSIQWHTKFADSTKTDIIWWTDHRATFEQEILFTFNFTNGIYDSINNVIYGLAGNEVNPTKWIGDKNGGKVRAIMTTDTLSLSDNQNSTSMLYSSFVPRGSKGMLRGMQRLCRPITSKPIFSFNLSTNNISNSNDKKLIFEVYLSYHFYNKATQQKLSYNFVDDQTPFSYELIDSCNLKINYPIHAGNNFIQLKIENDAQLLKNGKDNTIQDVKIILETKDGNKVLAKFSHFQLSSAIPQDSINYKKMGINIDEYKTDYKVHQIIGTEITIDNKETTHLNGYLPDTSNQSSMYVDVPELNITSITIPEVHTAGGLVSLNHPFGTGFKVNYENQNYRTDTMAQYLLNNLAFGCDIIEVGYLKRGDVDISHHIKLWDILTANKLYMYGNGVGDIHGGDWIKNSVNFNSYIWAKDSTATNLIEGLKKGRFAFGDDRIYDGKFMFAVGKSLMGDRTVAKYLTAPLQIDITDIPSNAIVKLTQGLIQPGLVVNYIYNDSIIDWRNPPCLDISQPNFVRITMYIEDVPFFFSNPIVLKGLKQNPLPSLCLPEFTTQSFKTIQGNFKIYPTTVVSEINIDISLEEDLKYKICIIKNLGKHI
jgi:hypothetical protein